MDQDGSGAIDVDELGAALKLLGESMCMSLENYLGYLWDAQDQVWVNVHRIKCALQ
jgi:hypothetical protein